MHISGRRRQATAPAWHLGLLLLLLVAFALRVYRLDWQSLWYDEAQTLWRALAPLGQLAAATPVEHSPTYFALEHLWLGLAGSSDFALRYPSTMASVLALALAYQLGTRLGSRQAGAVAAALLATGMFQVWYAQEARMYSWMLASSLLATWLLWELLTPKAGGWRSYLLPCGGYVLAVTATIYLHHYGLLLPLAHAVFVILWLAVTHGRRAFGRWCAAVACVLVLYVPGAARPLAMLGYSGWQQTAASPGQLPWYFLTAYAAGDAMPAPWHTWLPWAYAALMVLGLYAWWRRNRLAGLLLACMIVLPAAAAWALAFSQPQFHERYTMMITGPLMLLVGNGVVRAAELLGRPVSAAVGARAGRGGSATRTAAPAIAGLAMVAVLVAANGSALSRLYGDTGQQKIDYKQVAARIGQAERPGDVILSEAPASENILARYYKGSLAIRELPFPGPKDEQQVADLAASATAGALRAWVVEGSGRQGSTKAWLGQNAWLADEENFNGLHVSLYGLPGLAQVRVPTELTFGPQLQLRGLGLAGGTVVGNDVAWRARDLLGVTTIWDTVGGLPSLRFSLRLSDAGGRVWQSMDYVPQAGYAPTPTWQPGARVVDRHGMVLAPDLPPGPYEISLTIYNSETGVPELAGDQETPVLARIRVLPAEVPPSPKELAMPAQRQIPLGGELEVLGYGSEPEPLQAQGKNTLQVWWRPQGRLSQAYRLQIELSNASHGTIAQSVQPLSAGPLDWWQEDEIVRARYDLALDPAAAAGEYDLRLALLAPDGGVVGPAVTVGKLPVQARSRSYALPAMLRRIQAQFGEAIALQGYSVETQNGNGRPLKLTLYWQALGRARRYKVFIHVLNEAGQVVAQADDFPAAGEAPTESWLPGEVIADAHTLQLPGKGRFRLLAGLYSPENGDRLGARDREGRQAPDGAVSLGEIQVH